MPCSWLPGSWPWVYRSYSPWIRSFPASTLPTADRNEHGHAIAAISATVRGGMDLGWSLVWPGADFTNATTTFPQTMKVDYVRVYKSDADAG